MALLWSKKGLVTCDLLPCEDMIRSLLEVMDDELSQQRVFVVHEGEHGEEVLRHCLAITNTAVCKNERTESASHDSKDGDVGRFSNSIQHEQEITMLVRVLCVVSLPPLMCL